MPKQKPPPHDETLFRAFIMGAAIVALGWAAFRYTEIPRLAIQKGIAWYEARAASRRTDLPPVGPPPPPSQAVPGQPGLLPPSVQHAEHLRSEHSDLPPPSPSFGLTNQPPTQAMQPPTQANQPPTQVVQPPTQAEQPVAFEFPASGRAIAIAAPPSDQRAAIEQRLAELGAVYSLLETFGRDQRRYRFHCDVTLAGSIDLTRSFEASGSDAIETMRRVLREVEAWRGPVVPAAW